MLYTNSIFTQNAFCLDQASFCHHLKEAIKKYKKSVFNERTDSASAEQYFQVHKVAYCVCLNKGCAMAYPVCKTYSVVF